MNNAIRDHRDATGLSQADLAVAVGVSRQTINSIERERYDPSLELALTLADFFECPVEQLFDPEIEVEAGVSER